ncbi:MAG: hemolysin [Pseudonocardiales bacterium]|nr:hemolysin [Pseudonocardiales bacterium]
MEYANGGLPLTHNPAARCVRFAHITLSLIASRAAPAGQRLGTVGPVDDLDDRLPISERTASPLPQSRPSRPGDLYDSARDLYYAKPLLRGWLHLVWFEAALVLGTLLLVEANGARAVTAAAIYAGSVAGLFGTSALYHRGNWSPVWSARLQRLDHTMIFMIIAGTATPAFLLAAPGAFGVIGLIVMWSLTGAAVLLHLVWMDAPEKLVGAAFIALGAVASTAIPAVWIHTGTTPAVLLIIASLLHATGAISYHRRRPDPLPAVFGYHEVFHTYVCLATACQYAAIGLFLI